MSRITLLTTVMALAMSTPALLADISLGFPRFATAGVQGNCDMMASNTVLASFVELRNLTVQRVDQVEPATVQVAVFEVTDNLAYRRFNRFADGRLEPGMQFTIAMNKELPGQPAEYVDTIAAMQPGDQVVMRVDHLYLMNGQSGESIRTCGRMARRNALSANPAAMPAAAPAPLPIPGAVQQSNGMHMQMSSRSFSMTTDANGQMQTVQTSQEYDPATGQMKTRMIINGVEVDPVTRQPLAQAAAPAPAPVSESQARQEAAADEDDDTIVEHNNNPVVQPGDKAPLPADIAPTETPATPAAPVAPAPEPDSNGSTISASESF
ncbi:MAG: hypothetical protein IKK73_03080 [Akkermansia sp.]|nr:hypothetical protein [Akkermansia sp.]